VDKRKQYSRPRIPNQTDYCRILVSACTNSCSQRAGVALSVASGPDAVEEFLLSIAGTGESKSQPANGLEPLIDWADSNALENVVCKNFYSKLIFSTTHGERLNFACLRMASGKGRNMEHLIDTLDLMIAPGVRETASEDGAVLLDIEQGICFSLNPVGSRIWELLKRRYSVDQIVDSMTHDFPVSRSQLLADIVEFLQSLEAKRLIHRSGHTVTSQSWLAKILPWTKQRVPEH
jgi:Coenzyme PQQ synthesis protein D (PqqD)